MAQSPFQNYTVIFSKRADKFLESLDKQDKQRILQKVRELKTNSKNLDIKKLKSKHDLYRIRVGNYRIIYSIEHEQIIIYIVAIGHRRDIYQQLNVA